MGMPWLLPRAPGDHLTKACDLTHWSLVTPYGDIELCQHWLGNGLLPDGTKPLPEPMLNKHH